jgi:hypothetical protein
VSELINRWFGRAARLRGALAYGLRYANATSFSHTWESRLSEAVLNDLWNRLGPMTAITMNQPEEAPELLRWTFNGGVVVGTARTDGSMFFVLTSKKTEELDTDALQRLLSEFRALRNQPSA